MAESPQIAQIVPDWRHITESFCSLGATEEQLATLFSVSTETVSRWIAEVPEFAEAVRWGLTRASAEVAGNLHRLACGYSHTVERVLMGREGPVSVSYPKHHPPNPRACIAWLVNRCPAHWGRAAIRKKLQAWEDERDAAARRPPFVSDAALAALIAARQSEQRALDEDAPAVNSVGTGERSRTDEPGATGGICRTLGQRVAAWRVPGALDAGTGHQPWDRGPDHAEVRRSAAFSKVPLPDAGGSHKPLIRQPNSAIRLSSSGRESDCHQSVTQPS